MTRWPSGRCWPAYASAAADQAARAVTRTGYSPTRPTLQRRIRTRLRAKGITATIPERASQIAARAAKGIDGGRPPRFDPDIYKQRNTVERTINRLRAFRAVSTRYDKRDYIFRGTIDVATIRIWLRDPVTEQLRDTP